MSIQQLILFVFAKILQGKYNFTTNKSLGTAPFPDNKSLKPTTSLVLH